MLRRLKRLNPWSWDDDFTPQPAFPSHGPQDQARLTVHAFRMTLVAQSKLPEINHDTQGNWRDTAIDANIDAEIDVGDQVFFWHFIFGD